MDTYISSIELTNYRSCKKTTVNLQNDLSALIGINGSGKSNFLNGILLLKKIARISPHPPDEEFFQSSCKIKVIFVIDQKELPFEAVIKYTTNERNIEEVINAEQFWDFKSFTGIDKPLKIPLSRSNVRQLSLFDFGLKPDGIADDEWETLVGKTFQIISGSKEPINTRQQKIIFSLINKILDFVSGISYYSASQFTDPSKCPTYFEIEDDRVLRRSSRIWNEHSQFMYDLYVAYKDPKSKFREFLSIVGNEAIGLIDTIHYDEIDIPSNIYQVGIGGRVISKEIRKLLVIPNFVVHSAKLSPNQLSEGTFKTLAIVFYLVTNTSSLLILEEPEVCIHHGLLSSILELVKDFSQSKQIIISTHSDYILDELNPENVYIVRNNPKNGTSIKHIPDALSKRDYKTLKEYLKNSGNLGEYWRHGELEK